MIRENLYKILGLPDFAPMDEVKKAYRRMALKHHPDRGGDLELMKKINVAYQMLSEKKAEYDMRLRGAGAPAAVVHYHYGHGDATNNTTIFTWTFNS